MTIDYINKTASCIILIMNDIKTNTDMNLWMNDSIQLWSNIRWAHTVSVCLVYLPCYKSTKKITSLSHYKSHFSFTICFIIAFSCHSLRVRVHALHIVTMYTCHEWLVVLFASGLDRVITLFYMRIISAK